MKESYIYCIDASILIGLVLAIIGTVYWFIPDPANPPILTNTANSSSFSTASASSASISRDPIPGYAYGSCTIVSGSVLELTCEEIDFWFDEMIVDGIFEVSVQDFNDSVVHTALGGAFYRHEDTYAYCMLYIHIYIYIYNISPSLSQIYIYIHLGDSSAYSILRTDEVYTTVTSLITQITLIILIT